MIKGFRIRNIVVMAMLVCLTAWSIGAAGEIDGKGLYDKKCSNCHGKDGAGNPKMMKMTKATLAELGLTDADTVKKTDKELAAIITDGVKGKKMTAWGKKLKAEEIDAIIKYFRSLEKKS